MTSRPRTSVPARAEYEGLDTPERPPHRSWLTGPARQGTARYAVALALVGAALLVRRVFDFWLGANAPYLQFFPAILLAASYGGFGPGALATAASAALAMYVYLPPDGFAVGATTDVVSLGLFAVTGVAIAWLNHRIRLVESAWRSQAELATSRAERLDAIINTTVDAIIVIDSRGRIEAFNRGAERMFGYPESEALGRNVRMLMPSPDREQHDEYLRRYLTSGVPKIIGLGREVTGRRRDGSMFPVHLSVGEMRIGGERKFTGMLHDLTNRAVLADRLRSSEARWRAVIDSALDAIIVIDAHDRIESFNPGAERMFGHSAADVLGCNVQMLMPSPYREEHDGYLARYLATGSARIIGSGREVSGLRKDGSTFPAHLSVGEVVVDGERKFTGILHDLSARVRIEEQLREQTALAKLGEMAAVIAHEVKNPLAGIRGAIQVFSARTPAGSQEAAVSAEIINRIDALDRMMKELLLFARTPQPRPVPTQVAPLVSTTATLLAEDPALRHVAVEVDGDAPPVAADPDMLKIVFQNLLINGAHATNGRGHIRVEVRALDSTCQIAFIDRGPGIPADVREKIFAPFFTTKSRGSGLGLPTAKRLIEAHQGHITVDCPASGGTTVVVTLPLA
jgi:two-component system sensor kinase FixL